MEKKFENKSILKLILTMGLPPIISMLMQSLYAIIDSWYVAKISQDAFNAVSIVFPIQSIVLSIAVGLGIAINGLVARSLGRKDYDKVHQVSILGIVLTAVHNLLIVVFGLLLITPFINGNTSSADVALMSYEYIRIILLFSCGILFQLTFEKILQGHGNMIVPTIVQICGCVLNIILDHILVLVLGYGVVGAASATVISQCLSALSLGIYILVNKNYTISFKYFKNIIQNMFDIYIVCVPSTLMFCLPSFQVMALNKILSTVDEVYINVLNIYLKVQTFIFMPISGLTQGLRPIIGYFYGSRNSKALKETLSYAIRIMFSIMLFGIFLFNLMPEQLIKMFFDDSNIIEKGSLAFRIISIGFLFNSVTLLSGTFYESMGYGVVSLVITLVRQLIVTIPLALLLVFVFDMGALGVWISVVAAEVLACLVSGLMFNYTIRNTNVFKMN